MSTDKIQRASKELKALRDILDQATKMLRSNQKQLWHIKRQQLCLARWVLRIDLVRKYHQIKAVLETNRDRGLVEPLMIRSPLRLY